MINYKVNRESKEILVSVGCDFLKFEVEKTSDGRFSLYLKINNNHSSSVVLLFKDFGSKRNYPNEIEIKNIDADNNLINLSYT